MELENEDAARIMLSRAVECCQASVEVNSDLFQEFFTTRAFYSANNDKEHSLCQGSFSGDANISLESFDLFVVWVIPWPDCAAVVVLHG